MEVLKMAHKRILLRSGHVILGERCDTFKVKTTKAHLIIRALLNNSRYSYFCTETFDYRKYADYDVTANLIRTICYSDINTPTKGA